MHKEKSAFPQSPGIRARPDYIISAHTAEVNQYTTISQELEHLQGWGLHITQHKEALFREYPSARKPFISLANLDIFAEEKSKQEILTLDDYALFHREFRRLATQLEKEKNI